MEQRTLSLYAETYTIHIFLPEYINECTLKQLRRILKIMEGDAYSGYFDTRNKLDDMLEAVEYCKTIAGTGRRKQQLEKKQKMLGTERTLYDD